MVIAREFSWLFVCLEHRLLDVVCTPCVALLYDCFRGYLVLDGFAWVQVWLFTYRFFVIGSGLWFTLVYGSLFN